MIANLIGYFCRQSRATRAAQLNLTCRLQHSEIDLGLKYPLSCVTPNADIKHQYTAEFLVAFSLYVHTSAFRENQYKHRVAEIMYTV